MSMRHARSLSLQSVTKSYGAGVKAVDAIDLTVEPGEFISFLGPSGSGKTTTLMMIAGFERPSAGSITIDGRRIDDVAPYDRNIGMVFQNYALFPHMSAADNVGFPLRMRNVPAAERAARVEKALAMVGLAGFAHRAPAELSGGQQQRVALARALVFEPDLVLLDEPLGALDKSLREQMQIELKRIHRTLGVTMIYVTHDQSEAMAMSDRIAVFNHGRIEQAGAPHEIYAAPRTRFVASFIGDSNILDGTVADDGTVEVPGLGRVATSRRDLRRGAAATILLRPEAITLVAPSPAGKELLLEETVNLGDSYLLLGRIGPHCLRVRCPSIGMPALTPGQVCHVEWKAAHLHVIDGAA
jgi:putative spermidine/putrescine transport system ATP-binding protein